MTLNFVQKEIKIFLTCVMFYTRIHVPRWVDHSEEYLYKSTKYFPLIGWIVGGLSALIFYAAQFALPVSIAIILSMIISIILIGAFHEDGFADFCDGFGGGWTKEKILEIMKDSRIGTYGAAGLILILLFKFFLLYEINITVLPSVIIFAHTLSRFTAVTVIYTHEYAREDELSKVKPLEKKMGMKELIISAIWIIPPFLLLKGFMFLLILIPVFFVKWYLSQYFTKWLGGYTGDCLGAIQQVTEITIYLSFLILWKFI